MHVTVEEVEKKERKENRESPTEYNRRHAVINYESDKETNMITCFKGMVLLFEL